MLKDLRIIAKNPHNVRLIQPGTSTIDNLSIRLSKAELILTLFNRVQNLKIFIRVDSIESVNIDGIECKLDSIDDNGIIHATITLLR